MFPLKSYLPIIAAIVILFLSVAVVSSQQPQDGRAENESKPYKRWKWAFEQRAYPRKEIPDDALSRTWRQLQRWRDLPQRKGSFRAQGLQPNPGRWTNIGPGPILGGQTADPNQKRPVSGRVSDIAIDPADPNHWLIGGAQGGVWETNDAGATWTPLTDDQPSLSIGAIAFDPTNPQIIYAGTGEAVFSGGSAYAGVGLLKSTDGGRAWQLLAANFFQGLSFSDIKIDPKNPEVVLAAVTRITSGQTVPVPQLGGVFKSTNGGMNWVRTLRQNNWATDLESDPNDFSRQYAALGRSSDEANNGVYRSTDTGDTWTLINGPWRTSKVGGVGRIEVAIAPSNPNVLYVSVQDAANGTPSDYKLLGIWKTENAWATPPVWVELTPDSGLQPADARTERQWDYDHEIIVDPDNPNVLYVGGVGLYKCPDTTVQPCRFEKLDNKPDNALHVDQHTMAWAQTPAAAPKASTAINRLPMSFELNQGQVAEQVKFISRGQNHSLFLTDTEAILQLRSMSRGMRDQPFQQGAAKSAIRNSQSSILRMKLLGANRAPRIRGHNRLTGKSNYFAGNDPKHWHTGIPNYEKVRYGGVWPGIDLEYYGKEQKLEYDFIVAPGANPKQIKLGFSGARKMSINRKGDLVLRARSGRLRMLKPYIYQEVNGVRKQVRGRYIRRGKRQIGFRVGAYDRSLPLVIDPVLVYSTYLGGNATDFASSITVDAAGNAYVAGHTTSTNFNPSQTIGTGDATPLEDVYVVKLNPSGTGILYSTIIKGNESDSAAAIAVDAAGNAYITGRTASTDFPVVNAFQSAKNNATDVFVAKLNPSGSALVYSSYLGGDGSDTGFDIVVDGRGHAWVTGDTFSTNFRTVNPVQPFPGGSNLRNGFVTELDAAGSSVLFSTYLGGTQADGAAGIAVDSTGNVYVTGFTSSADFKPVPNGYQTSHSDSNDAFVVCINNSHSVVWASFLGGDADDRGEGIAVDAAGNAYVTGSTRSNNFPIQNALQSSRGGGEDAFITKFSSDGRSLLYSGYFGGSGSETGQDIEVDSSGSAWLTGNTSSNSLAPIPNPNPIQPGGHAGGSDAFILRINPAGDTIQLFTYLGGSGGDTGWGIAVDSAGRNAWIAGQTASTNFRTTPGAYLGSYSGGTLDAFVAKADAEGGAVRPRLIVGNDGGVWSTADGGQTWDNHNTNLAITQFYLGSLHPTDPNMALGGSQDNGTEHWTGANPWQWMRGGDGAANAIASAARWMVSAQEVAIYRTTDGGITIPRVDNPMVNGITRIAATTPFIARCEKCPSNDDVFLVGTDRLWITNNFFSSDPNFPSWKEDTVSIGDLVTAIALAPSDSLCFTYAYGARNGQLRLVPDGGITPAVNIDPGNRVPNRTVTDLAFNPLNPDILYVTLSGFDEATPGQPGHVFKTENARSANPEWVNVTPPVNIPHNAVAVDPSNTRIVYVGTDMGVWKSFDEGETWEHFGPDRGMPNIAVYDIQISEGSDRIVAFTHGRGAFAFERNRADLAVTMTDTPDPVIFNQNLTYRLTVRNNGPDRATEIFLLDTLPEGVTFVSANASQGTCAGSANNISCYLGALANGASATVTIVVRPPLPGVITNLARVSSDEVDPNGSNDNTSVSTTVISPDLAVTKTHTPASVMAGQNVIYSVTVRNEGMVDGTGVVMTDNLPAGVVFISVNTSQGNCSQSNNIVSCNLGNLARSASATVTIAARVETSGSITNTASVTGNEPDSNPDNNTATDTLTIGSAPTITRITPSTASPGTNNLELKIEGAFFQPGAVISFSPSAGIEVLTVPPTDPGFISTAEIRRVINVLPSAPLGDRQMFVTNPNGMAGGVLPFNRFTIVGLTTPGIEITPESLSFGDLVLGGVKGLTLICRNNGTARLSVYDIRSSNPHFGLTSSGAPFTLDPGMSKALTVSFTPTASSAQAGELIFSSSATGKTTVAIPLRGNTPGACTFTVSPSDLSYPKSGGLGGFDVTTQSGCEWLVADPPGWLAERSFPFHIGSGSVVLEAAGSDGPRTAMVAAAGRMVTVRQAEQVASVSAASFSRMAIASESMTAAFGQNLATGVFIGNSIPLPTSLGGTTVKVRDSAGTERLSPLFFVSSGQINYQVPPGTTTGEALVTVTSGNGQVSMGTMQIAAVTPGVFTANASGLGLAAAVALRFRGDGSLSYEPVARFDPAQNSIVAVPIDLGPETDQVFLLLFGTGWRFRSSLSAANLMIGGLNSEVSYAGAQGDFVGLDQINARLSRSLIGRGEVDLTLTVDGVAANSVKLTFK